MKRRRVMGVNVPAVGRSRGQRQGFGRAADPAALGFGTCGHKVEKSARHMRRLRRRPHIQSIDTHKKAEIAKWWPLIKAAEIKVE